MKPGLEKNPNLSHLRMFEFSAYMHIPADERTKFSSKARKCVFVGFCETQKGFRQWYSVRRRIFVSRDVIFNETVPEVLLHFNSDYSAKEGPCTPAVLPLQATVPPEEEERASDVIGVQQLNSQQITVQLLRKLT
jgi:hypothetical protein